MNYVRTFSQTIYTEISSACVFMNEAHCVFSQLQSRRLLILMITAHTVRGGSVVLYLLKIKVNVYIYAFGRRQNSFRPTNFALLIQRSSN